jgi:hypothetical protein
LRKSKHPPFDCVSLNPLSLSLSLSHSLSLSLLHRNLYRSRIPKPPALNMFKYVPAVVEKGGSESESSQILADHCSRPGKHGGTAHLPRIVSGFIIPCISAVWLKFFFRRMANSSVAAIPRTDYTPPPPTNRNTCSISCFMIFAACLWSFVCFSVVRSPPLSVLACI